MQYPTELMVWNRELGWEEVVPFVAEETAVDGVEEGSDPEQNEDIDKVILTVLLTWGGEG